MPADPNHGQSSTPDDSALPNLDTVVVKSRILIVDHDTNRRRQTIDILADLNHQLIEAGSTREALLAMANHPVDLIIVDINVPEAGGSEFCRLVRNTAGSQAVPVFIQAPTANPSLEVQVFNAGADEFLAASLDPSVLRTRVQSTLRIKSMMESFDNSETVLFSLAKSVEDRDPELRQHCQRLALMASVMGVALGLPPAAIRSLQHGGYLHDIGKIGIPDRVLFKTGPLTPEEWEIMRTHVLRGERLCTFRKSLAPVLSTIRHHHEKYDGTGYPDGLKGEEIPLLARILQVVDIYDALTTERPYKRAYSPEDALAIMREETKKGWRDPHLVEVFAELLPIFCEPGFGDTARFSVHALSETLEKYRRASMRETVTDQTALQQRSSA